MFYERLGTSWISGKISASQEGLFSLAWVSIWKFCQVTVAYKSSLFQWLTVNDGCNCNV